MPKGNLVLLSLRIHLFLLSMSQPHFEANVKMKLTLSKVGTWSPLELPKTQSLITRPKTPCNEMFFISLESS